MADGRINLRSWRSVYIFSLLLPAFHIGLCEAAPESTVESHPAVENPVNADSKEKTGALLKLPAPEKAGTISVEAALSGRRSVRRFNPGGLTLKELSQLLWAAQGVTNERGFRTAPSAGALYPLEVYVCVGEMDELAQGVYRYRSGEHALEPVLHGDIRPRLPETVFTQKWIRTGAVTVVIGAVYARTTKKYGDRGVRYAHMEAGAAAQNIYLQAGSLGLGVTLVGAFRDDVLARLLSMPDDIKPLVLMPVGRRLQ